MQLKRMLCVCLSALILLGAMSPLGFAMGRNPDEDPNGERDQIAAQESDRGPDFGPRPVTEETAPSTRRSRSAAFTLGNTSEMMLAGGGRMVQTPEGLFFLGAADGCVYRTDGETTVCVLDEPARCLNWLDGTLYYALCGDGEFSLWSLAAETGERTPLLEAFSGELKQFYAASDGTFWFLADDTVWQLTPSQEPSAQLQADGIVSFVPTTCGLVYACGTLFDYNVYCGGTLLVEQAEEYYTVDDAEDCRLVYVTGGETYQISLADLCAGSYKVEPFTGIAANNTAADVREQTPEQPEEETVSVEPVSAVKRDPEASAPVKRDVSQGMINIALRAYQMTDVKWKCVHNVYGWKSNILYIEGMTYTGLPYGQPIDKSYVPWNVGYSQFLALTADANSAFYHDRSTVTDGLAYATDCSAFVAWAWQTGTRMNTVMLAQSDVSTVVGNSYANAQIGDCINNIGSHVVLITNIKYNTAGEITAIEIAAANVNAAKNYCCAREWYGAGYAQSLADLQSRFFAQGYQLYRYNKRNSVTFTPEASVPVSHDASPSTTTPTYTPVVHYGMDVSQWQGTIDWSKARNFIEFAIIRCSHSTTTLDSQWERNVAACIQYKIPYGVYIYAKATTPEEAIAEAKLVIQRLNGRKPDLPIYYDVEDNDSNLLLDNDKLYEVVAAFCNTIEAAGLKAGVYSFTSAFNEHLVGTGYSKWSCWVAQINDSYTCTYRGGFHAWQYSWKGKIPGITDPTTGKLCDVDLDVWVGDIGDLTNRYTMTRTAATCTKSGKVVYTSLDGKTKLSVTVQSLGHDFNSNGKCTRCGAVNTSASSVGVFADVSSSAWYFSSVSYVVQRGLFSGTSATTFNPDGSMTRAMLVTVLWRMAGAPRLVAYNPFVDVLPGTYYFDAVTWAYQNGAIGGVSATRFAPSNPVTREQMAVILYKLSGQSQSSTSVLNQYADSGSISNYAKYGMAWAVRRGVISGVSATELNPLGTATRAQVATIIRRYVGG